MIAPNPLLDSRSPTKLAVGVVLAVLVGAVLALTYGNHLAEIVSAH